MTLAEFNNQDPADAAKDIATCCGSAKWQAEMMKDFPFADEQVLLKDAEDAWVNKCTAEDWLEAFTHHPTIGDTGSIAAKFASTQHLAVNEQAGVNEAPLAVIQELALLNAAYEKKFGYIFIVCATGKSAAEMLELLKNRMQNEPPQEIKIAMKEQSKITALRLHKILGLNN